MADSKRKASTSLGASSQLVKRARAEDESTDSSGAVVIADTTRGAGQLIKSVPRTSGLQAPIMELSGHSGEIFAVRFDPSGQHIASGSFDRSIFLWNTYGDCDNYRVLNGHKGAVMDVQWSRDSSTIFSASADMMLAAWDAETAERIRRFTGHEEVINVMDLTRRGPEMIYSGSDDGTIGIWDPRQKLSVDYIETNFPITAVAISEAGNELFSGGIDNEIKVWDLRKKAVVYSMRGHQDTVTSLSVSPDGQSLLSSAMDGTVRTWDVRAFAPSNRQQKVFDDALQIGLEKNLIRSCWSPQGDKIASGSGDRTVSVWDVDTRKLLYKLPGHRGTVNDVRFSPVEPIIASASSDRNIMLGELAK